MELGTLHDDLDALEAPSTSRSTLFSPDRKRFQAIESYLVPVLTLDAEGNVQHLSPAARRLLEYGPEAKVDECFFTHVHGKNLYRVMQDIAHMVCFRLEKTSWLLRMQTGRGRYRWYKATVHNRLDAPAGHIAVMLEAL